MNPVEALDVVGKAQGLMGTGELAVFRFLTALFLLTTLTALWLYHQAQQARISEAKEGRSIAAEVASAAHSFAVVSAKRERKRRNAPRTNPGLKKDSPS
jgi:hypothetical protein